MATFTINTGTLVSPTNIDTLSGKTGGDTYNINGGVLQIDQDSRYGLNNDTSSIMGTTTLSATLGGSLLIDARYIRIIPYDNGSGNVPAYNTTISGSTGSGLLIGVYDTLASAPTAVGAAMPADGYIKIKAWDEVAFTNNDSLTGIGADVALDPIFGGTDRAGWLEYVGQESTNFTLSRLNNPATPLTRGDWFNIGITDGTRSTTYQIPTNGVLQYHPGVWVENPNSASVTAASYDAISKRVTYTATGHGFETGDQVTITGVTPTTFNTKAYVTVVDANTFYCYIVDTTGEEPEIINPGTYTSGGTAAGNWEFYPATSDTMVDTNISTSALKGKFCKIGTDGLVRFGHDGTNSSGGYCPPSGRIVRMPNIFMTSATSAAKTQNNFTSLITTRHRFITSGAAYLDLRNVSSSMGFGSITTPQTFNMTDSSITDGLIITNPATKPVLTNVGIGSHTAYTITRINPSTIPLGMTMTDCVIGASGQGTTANLYLINPTDGANLDFTGCKFMFSGARGATSQYVMSSARTDSVNFTNCILGGNLNNSSTTNVNILGCMYWDSNGGTNVTTNAQYFLASSTLSTDALIEGLMIQNGDLNRAGMISGTTSAARITFRNIGTRTDPIGTGLYEEDGASWSRSGTTVTVTTASSHGLTTGDSFMVYRTDVVASISRAVYVVTGTPTATTFTFTATNSGATSGVLSYYPVHISRLMLVSNTDSIKFQNVHVRGFRGGLYSMDNTSLRTVFENVSTTFKDATATIMTANNLAMHSSEASPINASATSSVYGTHLRTTYVADTTVADGTGVSWTRSSSLATITKTDHGLVTGSRIFIKWADNPAAFVPVPSVPYTATVLTKDTFTVACISTGTTSGTLDYVAADGRMTMDMNEPNTESEDFVTLGNSAAYTGAGTLTLFNVDDYLEYETDRWILGFDSFAEGLPICANTSLTDSFDFFYKLDTGSGYSAYKNWSYRRTGAGGSSASTTVTMTDTTGVNVGDYVYGIGIAKNAKVSSITNGTDIVVDIANESTVSGTLYFSYVKNEASFPTTGFKLKVKVNCVVANSTAITFFYLPFISTTTTRDNLYSQVTLPTQTVTITGATAGSRIQLYDLTAGEELYNGTPTFPYTWTDTEEYVADREIRLRVSYVSGTTAKEYISTTIGTATQDEPDLTYLVTQEDDAVYNTNAVNGSTTTGITVSATRYSLTASKTCAQIYAFAMYTAFTETGIRDYGLAMTAVDTANYLIDEVLLKNTSSPTTPVSVTGGWVRDFDTGVALDLVDTTGGTLFLAPDHVVAYASANDYEEIASTVWSDTATYGAGTKGKLQKDAADSAELASVK